MCQAYLFLGCQVKKGTVLVPGMGHPKLGCAGLAQLQAESVFEASHFSHDSTLEIDLQFSVLQGPEFATIINSVTSKKVAA